MAVIIRPKRWTAKPPVAARINRGHPLANGLIAQWLYNEGGGRPFDSASRRYHYPTLLSTMTWTVGRTGSALASAATASGIGTDLVRSLPALNAFTWEAWLKPGTGTLDPYGSILTQSSSNGIFLRSTSKLDYLTSVDHLSTFVLPSDRWTHCVITQDASLNFQMYFNGVADLAGTGASNRTFTTSLNDGSSETYIGGIELMRVWTRVLSQSEIRQLMVVPYDLMIAQSPVQRLGVVFVSPPPVTDLAGWGIPI